MNRDEMDAAIQEILDKNIKNVAATHIIQLDRKIFVAGVIYGMRKAAHIASKYDEHLPTAIFIEADSLESQK